MTVLSVSELTGPILVTNANPGLDSIMWIVKFNVSATACITIASAHDPGVTYKLTTTNGLYYFLIYWTPILQIFMWWLGSPCNWWDTTLKEQSPAPPTSNNSQAM